MRAVEDLWEERQAPCETPPPRRAPQQPRQHQQQQGRPQMAPRVPQQLQQQQQSNWAQKAAAAAALPQTEYRQAGRSGKPKWEPTGLEMIKASLPWDERAILFERMTSASLVAPGVAAEVAAQVNIALSKVAPPHVRTVEFRISPQGRLTTAARQGASAAILLLFKKEIIEAARRADKAIINVVVNETWAELKILVPYAQYRHPAGLADLRDRIEAENPLSQCGGCARRRSSSNTSRTADSRRTLHQWSSRCVARP